MAPGRDLLLCKKSCAQNNNGNAKKRAPENRKRHFLPQRIMDENNGKVTLLGSTGCNASRAIGAIITRLQPCVQDNWKSR
jgi:hypothetical protein